MYQNVRHSVTSSRNIVLNSKNTRWLVTTFPTGDQSLVMWLLSTTYWPHPFVFYYFVIASLVFASNKRSNAMVHMSFPVHFNSDVIFGKSYRLTLRSFSVATLSHRQTPSLALILLNNHGELTFCPHLSLARPTPARHTNTQRPDYMFLMDV